MEMLSSFRGDKHEFSLVVIKSKYVGSCPALTSHIHDWIEWSSSDILSGEQTSAIVGCQQMNGAWSSVSQ